MEPRVTRAGPAHSETVIASFDVNLAFKMPKGVSLDGSSPCESWWVQYGKLHYNDLDGVERVVEAERKSFQPLPFGFHFTDGDLQRPEYCEVIYDMEDRLVDYWWRLVRQHVQLRRTAWYWFQLPSRRTTAARDLTEVKEMYETISKRLRPH